MFQRFIQWFEATGPLHPHSVHPRAACRSFPHHHPRPVLPPVAPGGNGRPVQPAAAAAARREVSINIESFIDHVYRDLHVISRLPDIQNIQRNTRVRDVTEAINFNIESEVVVTVKVAGPERHRSLRQHVPGSGRRRPLEDRLFPEGQAASEERKVHHRPHPREDGARFETVHRRHADLSSGWQTAIRSEFSGIVLAVLSLDGLTQKYLCAHQIRRARLCLDDGQRRHAALPSRRSRRW